MKPILTILVGPPGSGKSTWAKNFLSQIAKDSIVYINQDTQGKIEHKKLFEEALLEGKSIVVDRMNFNVAQRNRYLEPAKAKGYNTRILVFHTPYETCLERAILRQDHPTIKTEEDAKKAVYFFFKNYERVQGGEANEIYREGWVSKKDAEEVVICDLDGTLANVDHRRHHVRVEKPKKPNWKAFFEGMIDDPVNEWCRAILKGLSDRYRTVYATGRPGDYLEYTEMWLQEKGLRYPGSELFTRLKGDYRKDDIVKEIILEFEIKTRYNILFILDDRLQVVEMWRKHGYTVLQCDEGKF